MPVSNGLGGSFIQGTHQCLSHTSWAQFEAGDVAAAAVAWQLASSKWETAGTKIIKESQQLTDPRLFPLFETICTQSLTGSGT